MNPHLTPDHLELARALCSVLEEADSGDQLAAARLLTVRIAQPRAYVTLVGETSTGKSSLANGLLEEPLLPMYASPTTATVTHVSLQEGQETHYLAIYRDGTQQEIDHEVFLGQNERPIEEILRLQVRCPPSALGTDGLQVFDTPGYNALLASHEEILRAFLPNSDLIVFVAGYRTGFGQVDQDLLEVVQSSIEDDPDIPVVLVINRAPPAPASTLRRVAEIMDNATDCLKGRPILHIVPSTTYTDDGSPPPDPAPLPDTQALWRSVREIVEAPDRQAAVAAKLVHALRQLLGEVDDLLERRELRQQATAEELAQMREQVEILQDARTRSIEAVGRSMGRLANTVEPTLRRSTEGMLTRLSQEVDDANKWLDAEGCAAWLAEHAMPYEARQAAKMVEKIIETELLRLDQELQDIANTAVERIERSVRVQSDATQRFTINLVRTLVQRVGGSAISTGLKALGGVGGVAAGAGNLVKMIVKRAGALFNKTFGREVYNQIGRTFTKKMVQRMAGAIQLLVEAIVYVVEAKIWQTRMKKELASAVQAWGNEVLEDLRSETLPNLRRANMALVGIIYDDLIVEHATASAASGTEHRAATERITAQRAQIADLRTQLNTLSPSTP